MSVAVKPRRALPSFARWGTRLWAFSYRNVTYFASPDASGRWQVVAEHGQSVPVGPGGPSKAAAVRAALDAIDGEDQKHGNGTA